MVHVHRIPSILNADAFQLKIIELPVTNTASSTAIGYGYALPTGVAVIHPFVMETTLNRLTAVGNDLNARRYVNSFSLHPAKPHDSQCQHRSWNVSLPS
jgi:hypothetical protein